jgi:hypothetical protein
MKYRFCVVTICLCLVSLLPGCQKNSDTDNCLQIQKVRIIASKDSVNVGDTINLTVNEDPSIALFQWTQTNQPNVISYQDHLLIPSAQKSDEGWYYLSVSNPDCTTHFDSVYISVKSKAVPAPCTPPNNTVSFSSIPSLNPATVTWGYDNSWNRRTLAASGSFGYPDFNIYFNTYWDNREPEDGIYTITTMDATNDYPPYTVCITSLYSSVYFEATGQVYVSHVNNKLRVTFCSIPLSGSLGGPSFTTTATGMLTAP